MNKQNLDNHICVFCRFRPLNKLEISEGGKCCVVFTEKKVQLQVFSQKNQ